MQRRRLPARLRVFLIVLGVACLIFNVWLAVQALAINAPANWTLGISALTGFITATGFLAVISRFTIE